MSKVKWSISLFFAFLLVGVFGSAAFATDPYGLTAVQQGDLSLKVNYTANPSAGQDDTTKFDLYLIHPTDSSKNKTYTNLSVTKVTDPGTGSVTYPGSFVIPATDIETGIIYKLELTLAGADPSNPSNILSTASGLVINAYNTGLSHQVDVNGSGIINANATGYNNKNKSRSGQNVHGFYQNNTNSCASCHDTHTSDDSSNNLLFKDGVYSTCSACHDGTTGATNAFAPVNEQTPNSIAGTFNVMMDGHNGSLHQADGTLKVNAAPGGNQDATTGPYSQQFDCASCHAPHGSGSNQENNLNIDPLGWGSIPYDPSTNDGKNGKLYQNIKIYFSVPTTESYPYILVKTTTDSAQSVVDQNYFYKRAGVQAGMPIIQTYRWSYDDDAHKDGYVPDYSLWLQEKGYPYKADTALYNDVWTNLSLTDANHFNDASKDITRNSDVHVVWRDGFAWGPGVANVQSAQVSLGIDVETTDNIRSLFDSTYAVKDRNGNIIPTQSYIPDSGTEMSRFCASCHVDYLSNTAIDTTGVYSLAHRHKTVSDSLTCVRCHFAHGSEAQIMKTANDQTYYDLTKYVGMTSDQAIQYLLDPNPSSAIKRYTGMSVCYACHGQGVEFLGNPNNADKPVSGLPGTPRPMTYTVKTTVPTSVTKGSLLRTATDSDFTGQTPATFQTILLAGTPYSANVRVIAPNISGVQLWAKDSQGNWYDFNQIGWGPDAGFAIDPTVLSVYPVVSTSFTGNSLTIPFQEVDVATGTVVASGSGTINLK